MPQPQYPPEEPPHFLGHEALVEPPAPRESVCFRLLSREGALVITLGKHHLTGAWKATSSTQF